MTKGLKTLLGEVIDYAGLFPPARLPLPEALQHFAAYRRGPHAWILSRFVCPTTLMPDLSAGTPPIPFGDNLPWRFSALGRSGTDAVSFVSGIDADIDAIDQFTTAHEGKAIVDAIETKLPDSLVNSGDDDRVTDVISRVADRLGDWATTVPGGTPTVFLEVGFHGDWRRNVTSVVKAVRRVRGAVPGLRDLSNKPDGGVCLGLKIRTGGVKASMIAPVERVAFLIACCRDEGVFFKATAGLHHPLRHDSLDVGAKMHGFLNLFVAAVMAHGLSFSEAMLTELLTDESPDGFHFADNGLTWRDHHASIDMIARARAALAHSFGSCSVQEPVEDLHALGML